MPFAENTTVAPEKSQADIQATLRRYGATEFLSGWSGDKALIGFRLKGRAVRFVLNLPSRSDKRFQVTPGRHMRRSAEAALKEWEQEVRRRWRALLLTIKAKFEAVESSIETFEEAFMPHFVLPSGATISETLLPQLDDAMRGGPVQLLPALSPPKE